MSTEIYYFSGTGNSLFVARELQKRLPEVKLIPIVQVLAAERIVAAATNVGFVFPCHGLTVPIPVKQFLERIDVKSANYFFAIATRGGTVFCGFPLIDKSLQRQGKRLNATFVIDMYSNDPKIQVFKNPTDEELKAIEVKAQQKLDQVKQIVLKGDNYQDDISGFTISSSSLVNNIMERFIPFSVHYLTGKVNNYFYTDAKCTKCGICEKVCPSGKITMANNQPDWQRHTACYLCYACLNFCPRQAIQIRSKIYMKSYTPERGRYPHPYATLEDMAQQKRK